MLPIPRFFCFYGKDLSMLVVTFKYSGGSHPNQERTVYFNMDKLPTTGSVTGHDFDADDYRRFDIRKMHDIKAEQGIGTDLNKMPSNVKPLNLIDGYKADGYRTHYDSKANVVVAYKQAKPWVKFLKRGENYMRLENSKGDYYLINFNVELDAYSKKRISEVLNG